MNGAYHNISAGPSLGALLPLQCWQGEQTTMKSGMSRRRLLQGWSGFALFVLVGPGLLGGRRAEAQVKALPQQVQYQQTPKGKQECSNCLQFVAPDGCKVVSGKINPKGWCLLYAAKPVK